ncbi:hypothetical protein DW178_02655 [Eggerthella sp. AM16-19]|nr:hypothetical protein DW178_02655 [Eggerthella sp. AM16-19]
MLRDECPAEGNIGRGRRCPRCHHAHLNPMRSNAWAAKTAFRPWLPQEAEGGSKSGRSRNPESADKQQARL